MQFGSRPGWFGISFLFLQFTQTSGSSDRRPAPICRPTSDAPSFPASFLPATWQNLTQSFFPEVWARVGGHGQTYRSAADKPAEDWLCAGMRLRMDVVSTVPGPQLSDCSGCAPLFTDSRLQTRRAEVRRADTAEVKRSVVGLWFMKSPPPLLSLTCISTASTLTTHSGALTFILLVSLWPVICSWDSPLTWCGSCTLPQACPSYASVNKIQTLFVWIYRWISNLLLCVYLRSEGRLIFSRAGGSIMEHRGRPRPDSGHHYHRTRDREDYYRYSQQQDREQSYPPLNPRERDRSWAHPESGYRATFSSTPARQDPYSAQPYHYSSPEHQRPQSRCVHSLLHKMTSEFLCWLHFVLLSQDCKSTAADLTFYGSAHWINCWRKRMDILMNLYF